MSYDAWLEQPYQERAAHDAMMEGAEAAYMDHFSLDEDDILDVSQDVIDEWYIEYLESGAEDAAVERAEALRDDPPDWDDDRW